MLSAPEQQIPPGAKHPAGGPRALGHPNHKPWATLTMRQMHPRMSELRWVWALALSLPLVPVTVWGQPSRHFSKNT